jgi:hypothetical protein
MATNLHKELTIRSISWMNSRMTQSGIRWGTEVNVCTELGCVVSNMMVKFPSLELVLMNI